MPPISQRLIVRLPIWRWPFWTGYWQGLNNQKLTERLPRTDRAKVSPLPPFRPLPTFPRALVRDDSSKNLLEKEQSRIRGLPLLLRQVLDLVFVGQPKHLPKQPLKAGHRQRTPFHLRI